VSKRWNYGAAAVAVAPPRPRFPAVVVAMSLEELREEWAAQESTLTQYERAFDAVIDAVWCGEDDCDDMTERPTDFYARADRTPATNTPELVAGIKSLYEYAGRLCVENERLRARVAELEARHD
jgi:hypothetical protein